MRVVEHDERVVSSGELEERRQRRDGPVHAEDAVGDDHPLRRPAASAQQRIERVEVEVAVDANGRGREPGAVDDAGVVQGVAEDHVLGSRQGCDHADVARKAGPEEKRGFGALELGELALELAVDVGVPGERTRSAAPGAVPGRGLVGRLDDARVGGEAEVVVRAEEQPLAALDHRPTGPGRRHDDRVGAPRRPAAGRQGHGEEAFEAGGHDRLSTSPARSPVSSPSRSVTIPLTTTWLTPVARRFGS